MNGHFLFLVGYLKFAKKTGRGSCELAAFETIHIAHVLEQVVCSYLCGSNDSHWIEHVFNYNDLRNRNNENTYFYRFEFRAGGWSICIYWFG